MARAPRTGFLEMRSRGPPPGPGEGDRRGAGREARDHCREAVDYVTMDLFDGLLADEEGHIDFLETQLDLHERVGAQNYAQLNASRMDETE